LGLPGAGKTSLLAHLAGERMTRCAFGDVLNCRRKVEGLQARGFGGLAAPETHLVFSDIPIVSDVSVMPPRKAYLSPIERVGLHNPAPSAEWPQTWFFPPYAQFYLSEAQRKYNSRAYKTFPDHVSQWYETHRHNGHNVTLDSQSIERLDKNIRRVVEEFVYIVSRSDRFDRAGRVAGAVWDALVFFSYAAAEKYEDGGEVPKNAERRRYEHDGNIFACYDSYCYDVLHYESRGGRPFDLFIR
jgi:hypothetical protein